MTEIRTYAQALYPGSFLPETSAAVRLRDDAYTSDRDAVAQFMRERPEDRAWFALKLTRRTYRCWTDEDGTREWRPDPAHRGVTRAIYVGRTFDVEQVEDWGARRGENVSVLVANMRGNGWNRVVRTRRGNWQPVEAGDGVLAESEVPA